VPTLRIELELEQTYGRVFLMADSHEDELRLRSWLRRSKAMADLPDMARRLLDDLDELDERDRETAA
jgi:hypothetical protein